MTRLFVLAASIAITSAFSAPIASAQTPAAPKAAQAPAPGNAQTPADQFAMRVATAWQSGGDLTALLDATMRKVVDEQTNGTGVYRQIKALGAVKSAEILGEQALNSKTMTAVKVTHENGASILVFSRNRTDGLAAWISLADTSPNAAKARAQHPMCFVLGRAAC